MMTCAACGAEMTEAEAMPAPENTSPALFYHREFAACVDVIMPRYWERRAQDSKIERIAPQEAVQTAAEHSTRGSHDHA